MARNRNFTTLSVDYECRNAIAREADKRNLSLRNYLRKLLKLPLADSTPGPKPGQARKDKKEETVVK
jgi:hypothetical protein